MNNQLENQLAKVVEKSLEIAERTGEFVIEQAPDLLREFYTWHITESSLYILLSFLSLTICFIVVRKYSSDKYKEQREWCEIEVMLPMIFSIFGIITSIIFFVTYLMKLLKIIVAPKIYLIEYFIG